MMKPSETYEEVPLFDLPPPDPPKVAEKREKVYCHQCLREGKSKPNVAARDAFGVYGDTCRTHQVFEAYDRLMGMAKLERPKPQLRIIMGGSEVDED